MAQTKVEDLTVSVARLVEKAPTVTVLLVLPNPAIINVVGYCQKGGVQKPSWQVHVVQRLPTNGEDEGI